MNDTKRDWDRLRKASDILSKAPIYIDASPGISIIEIEMKASAIKEKKGTSLIIIDHLQLIKGEPGAPNQRVERTEMVGDLKRLAEKLDVPVMLLFQLDINVEERDNKRPTLIDLADAGSLDQDANLVLFIYRDEIYHPGIDHHNKGHAEIIIAKNRRGSKGMAALKFTHQYSLFENVKGCGEPCVRGKTFVQNVLYDFDPA